MTVINLGLDFGSTGLRAACARSGEPPVLLTLTGADWPWVLCEPAAGGPLPVSFPSVKSRLGVTGTTGPAEVVAKALNVVRERIIAGSAQTIEQTVISVPARYLATQRTALLDVANDAGLGQVSLISDSVAAVIGHTNGEHTGTFLVYGLGYSGFELGLVRAVRGRIRVLGYEGAGTPAGGTLDAEVMAGWLATLHASGSTPEAAWRGQDTWLRLRQISEEVKEQLVEGGPVLFPMAFAGPDGIAQWVAIERDSFESLIRSLIARTLDRADALFRQAEVTRDNVDAVLLVGGGTRMPQLHKLVSGLGATVVPDRAELIARGAALHANRLTGRSVTPYEEQPGVAANEPIEPVRDAPPLAATLLTAPASREAPAERSDMDRARQLIKAGRPGEAVAHLRALITEAQQLLAEVTRSPGNKKVPKQSSADDLLEAARVRISHGQYPEALQLAHAAWQQEPDRPDVFDRMIEIHCDVAMGSPAIATFTRDQVWLRCALNHDPSNLKVRNIYAERIFLHGKELHQSGRKDEARRVLREALAWAPDYKPAEDLLHRLASRRVEA